MNMQYLMNMITGGDRTSTPGTSSNMFSGMPFSSGPSMNPTTPPSYGQLAYGVLDNRQSAAPTAEEKASQENRNQFLQFLQSKMQPSNPFSVGYGGQGSPQQSLTMDRPSPSFGGQAAFQQNMMQQRMMQQPNYMSGLGALGIMAGMNPYVSPYGGMGGYGSPYNNMGAYGSPYGGMGGYGSPFGAMGGYGSPYGGMGDYGSPYGGYGSPYLAHGGAGLGAVYQGYGNPYFRQA